MQKFIQKEKLKKLGRFFKSHTVITALIFAVVFMSLPFFFKDNSAVKDFTDKYIQKPLSWITGNPLSAKFKTLAGDYKVGVKNILGAFGGSAARKETETARADEARGSAYREPRQDITAQQGPAQISGTGGKEYVRVDGNEIYQVFTDDKGRKFVVTDEGVVAYEEFTGGMMSGRRMAAARKAAPNLENWQIAEAVKWAEKTNYPGGVENFLKSGDYAKLSRDGTRSIFKYGKNDSIIGEGEPVRMGGIGPKVSRDKDGSLLIDASDIGGGKGGRSFGGRGSGGGYYAGGATGKQSSEAKAADSKTKAQEKEKQQNNNANTALLEKLISFMPEKKLVEDNPKEARTKLEFVEESSESEDNKKPSLFIGDDEESAPEKETAGNTKDNKGINRKIQLTSDEGVIITDSPSMAETTTELLCGGKKCDLTIIERLRSEYNDVPVNNPWVLPKDIKTGPAWDFWDNNKEVLDEFESKYSDEKKWKDIDIKYNITYRPEIQSAIEGRRSVTIAVLNGYDENNNVKGIPNDNYYWQRVNYLFIGKDGKSLAKNFAYENERGGYLNELVSENPSSKPDIAVVPIEKVGELYKKLGYNTAVCSGVITPDNLNNCGESIAAAAQRIINNDKALAKATQELKENLGNAASKLGKNVVKK